MDEPVAPTWVFKRDGRQVPFEADRISRALFAASEALGRPDPFLARELADGVVHFLAADGDGEALTTGQIEDAVITVVRELGHPALASAFADYARRRVRAPRGADVAGSAPAGEERALSYRPEAPPAEVLADCARAYTLQAVFARDLAAAHAAGLLTLTGLTAPGELAGYVLGPPLRSVGDLLAAVEGVRHNAGRFALDGPEYVLAGGAGGEPRRLVEALTWALRLTGLGAVVNLNSGSPPGWAGDLARGPLFADRRRPEKAELAALADGLFEELLAAREACPGLRVDWHLGEADFGAAGRERLLRVAGAALGAGASLGFVFDRPRRPVALAEGLDRQHPAALLLVGLNLPELARQPGMTGDATTFLHRLGSLARLALSAGVQKRAFLRTQERARPAAGGRGPALTSGFLLDRARLVVTPLGLNAVVAEFTGEHLTAGGAALDFGRQVVLRLRDVLRQDGRAAQLDACVDGPFDLRLGARSTGGTPVLREDGGDLLAGLTPGPGPAPVRSQIRAGGWLHGAAEHGTLAVTVPEGAPPEPGQVAKWLRAAWQADVVRLRVVRR
jgi:hypothetical protein